MRINKSLFIFGILLFFSAPAFCRDSTENKSANTSPFSQVKFLPDISFITDVSGLFRTIEDEEFASMEIPGFIHGGSGEEHGHSHAPANGKTGFNFNYAELALYSVVDPYFELTGIFHLSLEGFEIEEAFFNTTCLPSGFSIKAGKFLSSFGRLNSQHAHSWNFADQPLVYNALLGHHGIDEVGAQISWLAPMNFYLLCGTEVLMGANENSFGNEGFHDANDRYEVKDAKGPNLYTGFIKTSFDVNNYTIYAGFSGAYGGSRINHGLDAAGGHAVFAETWLLGADITQKWYVDSYRYVSLQAEYIYRIMDGDHYHVESDSVTEKTSLLKKQSGLYGELIIKPFRRWKIGMRGDLLPMNRVELSKIDQELPDNMYKVSAMMDCMPSEFSLFRLQYNYDRSKYFEEKLKTNHEIMLQANISIGAHGAHAF